MMIVMKIEKPYKAPFKPVIKMLPNFVPYAMEGAFLNLAPNFHKGAVRIASIIRWRGILTD